MRSFSRVTTTPPSTQIYALIAKLSNNFTIFLTPCHFFAPENKKGCRLSVSNLLHLYPVSGRKRLRTHLGAGLVLQLALEVGHSLLDGLLVKSLILVLECEAQSV